MRKRFYKKAVVSGLALLALLSGYIYTDGGRPQYEHVQETQIPESSLEAVSGEEGSEVPEVSPYEVINNNVPFFSEEELTTESFERYAELDELGRCGAAFACVGIDLMPTEERGTIGMVKPTGWHTVKYDCVDGMYLYNRCHLIGYQLSGENANEKNLITGTRYLNVVGMLPFENIVADYVKETENHVMYRVTPYFEDDNLLADGVLIEAYSVEDEGAGVQFCVFCYNVQPGIEIDYATGESRESGNYSPLSPPGPSFRGTSSGITSWGRSSWGILSSSY